MIECSKKNNIGAPCVTDPLIHQESDQCPNILITEGIWGQRRAADVSYLCRLSEYSRDGKEK